MPSWRLGCERVLLVTVAVLCASRVARARSDFDEFPVSDAGGQQGPLPLSTPAGKPPTSAFSLWLAAVERADVPGLVGELCKEAPNTNVDITSCLTDPGQWCSCFGPHPNVVAFDLTRLLSSRPVLVAAYLSRRDVLESIFRALVRAPKTQTFLASQGDNGADRQEALDKAAGLANTNAPALAGVLGLVPGIDRVLDNALQGLAAALLERAKREAADYVLGEMRATLCKDPEDAQSGLSIKQWLPNTCAAVDNGVADGRVSSGGLAALSLLRQAMRADVRTLPARVAAAALSADASYKPLVGPVTTFVEGVVGGLDPIRALRQLADELADDSQYKDVPQRQTWRCLASLPSALLRAQPSVEAATTLTAEGKALATLLLGADGEPTCTDALNWRRQSGGLATLSFWLQNVERLRVAAATVAGPLADVQAALAARKHDDQATSKANTNTAARVGSALVSEGLAAVALGEAVASTLISAQALEEVRARLGTVRGTVQLVATALSGDVTELYQVALRHRGTEEQAKTGQCLRPCVNMPENLLKYGGLLIAIASADNPDEVRDALLAAATPAGGWRAKTDPNAGTVITAGALVGFGVGAKGLGEEYSGKPQLLVPVGIDVVALPMIVPISVFVQILDLGGYTRYLETKQSKPRPLQALSPGVAAKVGIPTTPAAVFFGAAYDVDGSGPKAAGAKRFFAGVGIDATLFVLQRD